MGLLSTGIHSEAPGLQLLCQPVPAPEGRTESWNREGAKTQPGTGLAPALLWPNTLCLKPTPGKQIRAKYPERAAS